MDIRHFINGQSIVNLQRNLPLKMMDKCLLVLSKLDNITNYICEYIFYTFLTNNLLCFSCKCSKRFGLYNEA